MFENLPFESEFMFFMLRVVCLLKEYGYDTSKAAFDCNFSYENYIEALSLIDKYFYYEYSEEEEIAKYYLLDADITEYVVLAHAYGKKHHFSMSENKYFTQLDQKFLNKAKLFLDPYQCSVGWNFVRKKNYPIRLTIYAYEYEFYDYFGVIQYAAEMKQIIRDGIKELKEVLQTEKIIHFPKIAERKAA